MLNVTSPQQVMLEVKVAEVSKTLINQMGSALNIQGGFGSWSGALVSNLLAGVATGIAFSKANNKPFNLAADAQNTDNMVKILAEPNLVTISGQEATFSPAARSSSRSRRAAATASRRSRCRKRSSASR